MNNKKQNKEQAKAKKRVKKAIRNATDKFVNEVLNAQKCAVFSRKTLRNMLRRYVGNKRMNVIFHDLKERYNIVLVG